ncbi:MAG: hypothetical protein J7K66_04720 [Anaerolineaceae bacterium]|nr:hypothetical protein [Anaerolineaceae bacterium]
MDVLLSALAIGGATFVIFMVAFFISRIYGKKKVRAFQDYAKQNFPDLPEDTEIFPAQQKSKKPRLDIALLINDSKKEIILLFANKGEELKHKVFSFKDLISVESSDKMLARGALPKTYSFEKTMNLKFKDGSSYYFILENISNKHGDDPGSDFVRSAFSPWEEKLNKILK